MKYYCHECKKEYEIGEENLIPGVGTDYFMDEYLLFYAMCPKCRFLNVFEECTSTDKEIIPPDMKLRLMKKYANVADQYYKYYESLRKLEIVKADCEKIMDEIKKIQSEKKDNSRLYYYWKDSESIVQECHTLQLK
ncbi:MAG: hypothetical protein IKR57_04830 [Bacilli bacterium]|nr:hypothetical protein [Bacilli bacterium]